MRNDHNCDVWQVSMYCVQQFLSRTAWGTVSFQRVAQYMYACMNESQCIPKDSCSLLHVQLPTVWNPLTLTGWRILCLFWILFQAIKQTSHINNTCTCILMISTVFVLPLFLPLVEFIFLSIQRHCMETILYTCFVYSYSFLQIIVVIADEYMYASTYMYP